MKKNLWMLGVAVAVLTSCAQSEVLEVSQDKMIVFEEFVEKNSRAFADIEIGDLEKYWVYGYYAPYSKNLDGTPIPNFTQSTTKNVFQNQGMTMTFANNKWNYSEYGYWIPNHLYRFAAYSDGNNSLAGVSYDPIVDQLTIPSYSVFDYEDENEKMVFPKICLLLFQVIERLKVEPKRFNSLSNICCQK